MYTFFYLLDAKRLDSMINKEIPKDAAVVSLDKFCDIVGISSKINPSTSQRYIQINMLFIL
jgi:hypothetical protein